MSSVSESGQSSVHTGGNHFGIQTSVPLMQISLYEHEQSIQEKDGQNLPQLPSHKFRYTVWHELKSTHVKGDELRAPRVREGPESAKEEFHEVTGIDGEKIHHDKTGSELRNYQKQQENWELARHVNLSSQKLEQGYQKKNLDRILTRLDSVVELILRDNSLTDLDHLNLPHCVKADLSHNYFNSFKRLPRMAQLEVLCVRHNQIRDVSGLDRFPRLKTLELRGNGLYYGKYYRNRVFRVLPNLKLLDNVLKLPADEEPVERLPGDSESCTIL